MRPLVVATVTSAACVVPCGIGLGGCGGTPAVTSLAETVAQAAQLSEQAPGFKVALSEQITGSTSSEPITGTGTGEFDQRSHRGVLSVSVNAAGHTTAAKAQYTPTTLYERLPTTDASPITRGRPWILIDLAKEEAALGIDAAADSAVGDSFDPTRFLSFLRGAEGAVTRVGIEPVRGVATTRYRATINYGRYASSLPAALRAGGRENAATMVRLTGSDTQPVQVWVDAQHHVRRVELSYHECLPGASGRTQLHLGLEYYDFATQVIPAVPPATDVADITGYLLEKLKGVRFGCR